MRKFLMLVLLVATYAVSSAQSFSGNYSGAAATIPGQSTTQKCFPISVTGVGIINGTTKGLMEVCINIIHPNDDELEIVLRAPDGTVVPLTMQNGGSGNNYIATCFSATATQPIKFGTAPFTGVFKPEGHIGAVNNGQNADGVWNICIQDRRNSGSAGTITIAGLTFGNTPAAPPPAQPACSTPLPSTSSCASATSVCDFNGLCGNTNGTTVQDWPGSGLDGPCFGLQNNSFIKFVASATTASFSIWVPSTIRVANYHEGGIQMLFFSGTCGSGPVTTYGCYPHILPYSGSGQPLINVVTASGLTPGNTYYLMIDGFNNDNCTFTIAANSGVNILNINPTAASICAGASVNLTASGGNGIFSWSPPAGLSATSGSTVTASPAGTTTYTVTSTGIGSCPITKDVTVTVSPRPIITAQPSTATQSICVGASFTALTVSATPGSGTITGYQWYSNTTPSTTGGTLIPGATGPTFTPPASTPGTLYYYCIITNSNNCTSTSNISGAITVNPPLPGPVLGPTVQPTCTTPTGTITITSPIGAGLQYSINGTTYQSSPVFPGVAPGPYTVTVNNGTCISAGTPVTINAASSTPVTPSVTLTQPSCTTPTGTITVTAPLGAGLQYSINGTTYQTSPVFPGVAPGPHTVTVTNGTCTSVGTPVTINAAPTVPAAPAVTLVQPTCTTPTGTITVTSPIGAGLQYSINGTTYQSSPVFPGVAPGPYTVTVNNGTCTSAGTPVTINAASSTPATPSVTLTQPSCTTPTGTITVTAPLGAGLQYSINGTTYQTSPVFPGVAPGPHTVTVTNGTCTSVSTPVTINAAPTVPAAPAVTLVQPTCTTPTGTITVTSPISAGLQYSINGTTYQSSPVFPGVAPGPYTVTVNNGTCISAGTPVTINAASSTPATPSVTLTQPSCTTPTGTITVTAPLGAGLQYSINGTTYQTSPVFPGVSPGPHTVTVTNGTCTSVGTPVTINPAPTVPAAPAVTLVQPTCTTPTGTITVTAPIGAGLQYSINGTTYQSSPIFPGVAPGPCTVTVNNGTCTSAGTPVTINAASSTPATPSVTLTQPSCTTPTGTITVTAPLGAGLQYSINGTTYQTSPVFPGVAPGPHTVTVTNGTCTSVGTPVTINTAPTVPAVPTATIVQPNCTVATGIITVTSPTGAGLQYSIDGTNYQSSPVFPGVTAGPYTVTVSNGTCSRSAAPVMIIASPATPATPSVTTVQPTCASSAGAITVTAPLGAAFQYSIDGINYQTGPVFSGVVPGPYSVTVRNGACVSAARAVVISAAPGAPAAPVATGGSRCGPGVVNLSASGTGGTLTWYSDAALTSQVATGNTYSPSVTTTTSFYVALAGAACTGPATKVAATINASPVVSLGANRSVCKGDALILNPGSFSSYRWQDNTTSPTFSVVNTGVYSVTVTNAAGCPATATVSINVVADCNDIYFPGAFTPNNDRTNDEFGPLPPESLSFVKQYNLIIYNRYGQRVFQSNDPLKKWDGKFMGKLTPGAYAWYASYVYRGKAITHKGTVIAVR